MSLIPYSVYNIPLWFKPIYWLHSYVNATMIVSYKWLILKTCRIMVEGEEFRKEYPMRLEAVWHYKGSMYFLALKDVNNFIQFAHPAWYMNKIILALQWLGCQVVVGSTGYGGKEAADQIVQKIKEGHCCCITPDGPYGPQKVLKKGVLHMAIQSASPIIPIRIHSKRSFPIFWQWDKKRLPLLFSTIYVQYQTPIFVTEETFEECYIDLTQAMGE